MVLEPRGSECIGLGCVIGLGEKTGIDRLLAGAASAKVRTPAFSISLCDGCRHGEDHRGSGEDGEKIFDRRFHEEPSKRLIPVAVAGWEAISGKRSGRSWRGLPDMMADVQLGNWDDRENAYIHPQRTSAARVLANHDPRAAMEIDGKRPRGWVALVRRAMAVSEIL